MAKLDGPAKGVLKGLKKMLDNGDDEHVRLRYGKLCQLLGRNFSRYRAEINRALSSDQSARLEELTSFQPN